MSLIVDCDVGGDKQRRRLELPVAPGDPNLAPYRIRQSLAETLQVDPALIRLAPSSDSTISIPQRITASVIDAKSFTAKISVREFQGSSIEVYVRPNDRLIDLKFVLGKKSGSPAEAHVLAPLKGDALPDSALVTAGMSLQLWYEIPSQKKGRGTSHRIQAKLLEFADPNAPTLQLLLQKTFRTFASHRLLGTRKWNDEHTLRTNVYTWQTFQTVYNRCRNFAAGLDKIGVNPGDKIGIMSMNRAEWAITDFSCMYFGFVSVTIYDTLGPDVVEYIVNHADVKTIVVSQLMLAEVAKVREKCPGLSSVIMMDDFPIDKKVPSGSYTYRMSQVEELGKSNSNFTGPNVTPDDMASICYTSGTTGNPKGVILTHRNLVSACAAINQFINDESSRIIPGIDTTISYLPLAHIYERLAHLSALTRGIGIGYFSGDTSLLVDDVTILKPTVFPGVPRVWQRIYDRINAKIADSSFITKKLFKMAFETKLAALKAGDPNPDSGVLDAIVLKSIADQFGGNLALMISGSAPISPRVATFMRICMRAPFLEGYGLTETCAMTTLTPVDDAEYGQVGVPTACCEVMLVDVASMSYLSSDKPCPRGEIWIRGPNVFTGYYKQPDVTSESITPDGWFRTGDIGRWRPDGRLQIIDRLKNIFKLAQGEYIRPDHIEGVYKMSPFIANIFVYGDSLQPYLVAIIHANQEQIAKWADQHNVDVEKNPKAVYQIIEKDMRKFAEREGLRGFEQVRKFRLTKEDFTIENGLLTPSLKLKRHEAKLRYQADIESMYKSDEAIASKL